MPVLLVEFHPRWLVHLCLHQSFYYGGVPLSTMSVASGMVLQYNDRMQEKLILDDVLTHRELQDNLAITLKAQKRLVLQEVDLCSRWANVATVHYNHEEKKAEIRASPGAPRIDVLRVSESYTRFEVFAYEVKASRADFLNDIRTGKWRAYLPYCHRFYFAVSYGVCEVSEVPIECGLLIRRKSGKGWQTVRQAPVRQEIEWSSETFLAVLFTIRRQPDPIEERNRRIRQVKSKLFCRPEKVVGKEIGPLIHRARSILAEEKKQSGEVCTKCGQWLPRPHKT